MTYLRISASDQTPTANPTNITILNLTRDDAGGTVQCQDFSGNDKSTVSTITIGELPGSIVL